MTNIADYISQLQTLTQRNIDLLTAINESFFTKREHLQVQLGTTQYVIPSFISLENKINALQENFENLVSAPKTGEAIFNIDGNSRQIELKGYTNTPHRADIDPTKIKGYSVENRDVFKDFMTPTPFIKLDLSGVDNDISHINVKKVTFLSEELKKIVTDSGSSAIAKQSWADLYKILSLYKEDIDYIMYDTLYRMPLRENLGYSEYNIKSIDKDEVDSDLYEYITVTLHEELKYAQYDGTIESYLKIGDMLVTYDDSAKLEIIEINNSTRQLRLRVVNGDYLNLGADPDNNLSSDMCKLKFFSSVDYESNKYINVPLEEDQYVAIFLAPTNDRMNIRAPWGNGILVNTYNLTDEASNTTNFKDYYDDNVRNIGDILNEISTSMSTTITRFTQTEFNTFTNYKPVINKDDIKVVQINTHLNNSTTVQNIRSLYSQKQEYNKQLEEVKAQISSLTTTLSEISFNDTTGVRNSYVSQLTQYNTRQEELLNSITKISNEIATTVNDSVIPIESAKYRIRGYFDWSAITDELIKEYKENIKGIRLQYRYKNQDLSTSTAISLNNGFIFSDWNNMDSFDLKKNPIYENGSYKFKYKQYNGSNDNGSQNEPSFNQIDIPISQGETVDIRLKIVWDFGYPFVETTSDWSDIVNITFPDEYLKDVQVTDIIDENNKDIEDNRFKNILKDQGVTEHINDLVVDQNETYYHQPDHIASGFYTEERRIIPLRDKLTEINTAIQSLQDIVQGTNNTNLKVAILVDGVENTVYTGRENSIILPAYKNTGETKTYSTQATIQITNNSSHVAYLYSIFPSNTSGDIKPDSPSLYNRDGNSDYIVVGEEKNSDGTTKKIGDVWVWCSNADNSNTDNSNGDYIAQRLNQWITFRTKNPADGSMYYGETNDNENKQQSYKKDLQYNSQKGDVDNILYIYPHIDDEEDLIINNANLYSYMTLAPNESLIIPLNVHYKLTGQDTEGKNLPSISRYIAFDLRSSLYLNPNTYIIKFIAPYDETVQNKISRAEKSRLLTTTTTTGITVSKYNTIIKNS